MGVYNEDKPTLLTICKLQNITEYDEMIYSQLNVKSPCS